MRTIFQNHSKSYIKTKGGKYSFEPICKVFSNQWHNMLQFNQAKTPQQNGVAKKMNHTFLDKVKSIMLENGTPNHLCAKAISTIP